jgi:prolyl-tRNA editing enzyme YbaK/EbsC (Cys-tRNA(Pro) deacylase)
MSTLQLTLGYLDRKNIRYVHTRHSPAHTAREVAKVEHMAPHRLAKTVGLSQRVGYGMAAVRADEFVDFEELRVLLAPGERAWPSRRNRELLLSRVVNWVRCRHSGIY